MHINSWLSYAFLLRLLGIDILKGRLACTWVACSRCLVSGGGWGQGVEIPGVNGAGTLREAGEERTRRKRNFFPPYCTLIFCNRTSTKRREPQWKEREPWL